jgi:hypothetical protein
MSKWPRLIHSATPLRLRKYVKDAMEVINRRTPAKPAGLPKYGLGLTQVYPQGRNFLPVLQEATITKLGGVGLSPTTPVCSIGTCFAEEFAYFMRDQGYNYVRTENDALAASANWGRVYTIPNLLQIVRYSMEPSYPLVLEHDDSGWFDPLREPRASYAPTRSAAEERVQAHRRASRTAFLSCEVLIITVGQNEAWVDNSSGQVWAAIPPRSVLDARKSDFSAMQFSFERNLTALREVVERLRAVNQQLRILFTVSPVASYASFSDLDVVSQSFANKCLLRAVVNEVVASLPGTAFYFPSFEIVLCDNPRNFRADNRHVKYATVERIFSMLSRATALN